MKRIYNIMVTGLALLAAASCGEDIPEVIDEMALGRCLVPTNVTARVQSGEYIYFSCDKSKAADLFVVELFDNAEMTGTPAYTKEIAKEEIPALLHVESDMTYYLRAAARSAKEDVADSKWYVHEKSLVTSAIKTSLNPELVSRTSDAIALKWTPDPEVDHLRVTPVLDAADEDYSKVSVSAEEVAAGAKTISGLKPSVKYTITVHFKSADRGYVQAWTLPDTQGATMCKDTMSIKQAVKDGATKIIVPFADTTYVVGEMALTAPLAIYGEETLDGGRPTIAGRFTVGAGVSSIHCENINFSGAETTGMSQQTHHITISAAQEIASIGILNCKIDGYQRGLYYDNVGASVQSFSYDNAIISNITGSGGDSFDIRKAATIGSISFNECTMYEGMRTFARIDAPVTVTSFEMNKCTLSHLVTAEDGNNNGLLHIRAGITNLILKNNLFLNMKGYKYCQLVGHNTAAKMPTEVANNYFYNCQDEFFQHTDASAATYDVSAFIANGGAVLSADPCVDSEGEKFNLTNTTLVELGIGDPRWAEAYVEVPEDLTLELTKTVKTWDFTNAKIFNRQADKDMVRDGIRFYVKSKPVVFASNGLAFSSAAVIASGVPADCGMGFKVDQPGSVVVSTADNGDDQAILVVNLDGKVKAAVPVGASNQKIILDTIKDGEEHMIYIYGTGAITVSSLQWSDDIDSGDSGVLATPALAIDVTSVKEGEDATVTVSWEAVSKAGSYDVTYKGKTTNQEALSFSAKTASLTAGTYEISVVAKPAASDLVRQPSEPATVSFTVSEVLKQVSATAETVWGADYMAAGVTKYGTGDLTADFIYGNMGYVCGGGKFKFGIDDADTAPKNRIQLGGTGAAGSKSCMQFIAGGAGTLSIVARSSGDNTTERPLAVAIGTATVKSYVTVDKTQTPATYTYELESAAGDLINIFSEKSGINLYTITWTPKAQSTPGVTDDTAINEEYMSDYTNVEKYPEGDFYENTTVDKITYMASSSKKVTFNPASGRVKLNGAPTLGEDGIATDRCISFKIVKPGTITFKAISSSSGDASRNVTVALKTVTSDGTKIVKLYSAATPVSSSAEELTVDVTADQLAGITAAAQIFVFSGTSDTDSSVSAAINVYKIGFKPAE